MKFRNKTTKVILTTSNEAVIEQLKKNLDYEIVEEVKEVVKPIKTETKKSSFKEDK